MKNLLGRLFSYILPIRLIKKQGDINKYLEVRLENGKYVLNTELVNYSFGGLHKVFKQALRRYPLASRKIDNVLILGFGAGSAASLLRKEHAITSPITGVEQDSMVIELAKKYFDINQFQPLTIHQYDAFEFVMNCKEVYDLIIMDVFIEDEVSEKFLQQDFVNALGAILSPKGILFYNIMVHTPEYRQRAEQLRNKCNKALRRTNTEKIIVQGKENWVLVCDRTLT